MLRYYAHDGHVVKLRVVESSTPHISYWIVPPNPLREYMGELGAFFDARGLEAALEIASCHLSFSSTCGALSGYDHYCDHVQEGPLPPDYNLGQEVTRG